MFNDAFFLVLATKPDLLFLVIWHTVNVAHDVIGDLALVGCRIRGKVIANKPGVEVVFYDENNKETFVKADYGIFYKRTMKPLNIRLTH